MPPAVNQVLLADIITSACALVCSNYRYIYQEEACRWLELTGLKTEGMTVCVRKRLSAEARGQLLISFIYCDVIWLVFTRPVKQKKKMKQSSFLKLHVDCCVIKSLHHFLNGSLGVSLLWHIWSDKSPHVSRFKSQVIGISCLRIPGVS